MTNHFSFSPLTLDRATVGRQLRRWWALFLLAALGAALVSAVYLALVSQVAIRGREIESLRQEIDATRTEIMTLKEMYASLTAYDVMAARATALGYRKTAPQDTLYVSVSGYVPPGPNFGQQEIVTEETDWFDMAYTQSLADWVLEYFLGEGR